VGLKQKLLVLFLSPAFSFSWLLFRRRRLELLRVFCASV
jgi:hypothetical protein